MSRKALKSEQGLSFPELLVAITAGIAVLMGSFAMLNGTLRGSARTQQRVDATQRARPVLTRIMDELHSACVAPGVQPILAGSSDTSIIFLHKTGNSVAPNPDKRTITLSGGTLNETVNAYLSGTAPTYTFNSTGTTTRLLTNVGLGTIDGVPNIPLFRYYGYVNGVVSTTPLATPLSAADAASTVRVDVTFSSSPSKTRVSEQDAAVTMTDSAQFRFSPGAEDAGVSNLPCT
jgi:hypothetical protein